MIFQPYHFKKECLNVFNMYHILIEVKDSLAFERKRFVTPSFPNEVSGDRKLMRNKLYLTWNKVINCYR